MSVAGLQPGSEPSEAAAIAAHRRTRMSRDLRRVFQDGCAWAAMMAFGEHLFQAMMVALALGESAAAFVVVSPALLGATVQLAAPWMVHRLGSHKRLVIVGSLLQVLCFVPLAIACGLRGAGTLGPGDVPRWAVYGVLSVYYFGGITAGTAWSTWVSTIVPRRVRGGYFSKRTRWICMVQLASLLCTLGLLSWAGSASGPGVLWGVAASLSIAGCSRLVSTLLESSTSEPVPLPQGHRWVKLHEVVWKMFHGPGAGLVICYFLMAVAQAMATPFLVPMVLGPLKEPEAVTAKVTGAVMIGRIAGYAVLPRLLGRFGSPRTLAIAGVALVPLYLAPAAWPTLTAVLAMQVVAGVVYACWEVTAWLMLLDHTPGSERTSYLTLHYFGANLALTVGAWGARLALGAFAVGGSGGTAFDLDGYRTVFVLSCIARALMIAPLVLWVRRAARVKPHHPR